MFCENCGKKLPEDALFCPECGKPVVPEGNPVMSGQRKQGVNKGVNKGFKKSSKKGLIIGICAAAAVVVCAGILLLTKRTAPAADDENTTENYAAAAAAEEEDSAAEQGTYAQEDLNETSEEEQESENEYFTSAFDMSLTGATEYRNGLAWVRYWDNDSTALSAIDTDGRIRFTLYAEGVLYCAPFEDDVSFFSVTDPDTRERYEIIVDEQGNECYRTGLNPVSGAEEEHVLCYGNGRFILARHVTGMSVNEWQIGAIDAYGNELSGFQACENAGQMGWFQTDTMNVWYDFYLDWDEHWRPVSRYLGDDIYYLHTGNRGLLDDCLYNANTGYIQIGLPSGDGLAYPQEITDGHIVTTGSGRYSIIVMTESFELENEYRTFSDKWDKTDAQFRNGMFYSAHGNYDNPNNFDYKRGYYDIYGNQVISLDSFYPEIDSLNIWGYPFYNDYAVVKVKGQDYKTYVTVINKSGEEQFEPIPIKSVLFDGQFFENCFVIEAEDGSWQFVNAFGEIVHNFSDDLPDGCSFWLGGEPIGVLRYPTDLGSFYTYFNVKDVVEAGSGYYELSLPALYGEPAETTEEKDYQYVSNLVIEGKWKSIGTYGFGQAQPGAIVVFDGINCNFFSPKDTYAFYPNGNWYTLDVTSFQSTDSISFTVKTIDENHIDVIAGGEITELVRVE